MIGSYILIPEQKYIEEAGIDKARYIKEMASYTPPLSEEEEEPEIHDTDSKPQKKRKKKDPLAPKGKKSGWSRTHDPVPPCIFQFCLPLLWLYLPTRTTFVQQRIYFFATTSERVWLRRTKNLKWRNSANWWAKNGRNWTTKANRCARSTQLEGRISRALDEINLWTHSYRFDLDNWSIAFFIFVCWIEQKYKEMAKQDKDRYEKDMKKYNQG